MANLTDTILKRKKVTGVTWVADDTCKGLRARRSVNKKGIRQMGFYYRYRDRTTSARKILKVVDYTDKFGIKDARDKIDNDLRPMADSHLDVKAGVHRQKVVDAADTNTTINEYIEPHLEFCLLSDVAASTVEGYRRYLRPLQHWHGTEHPSAINRGICQDIFYRVEKHGIPDIDGNLTGKGGHRSAGQTHSASRAFYSYLLDRDHVQVNPWLGQKKLSKKGESGISGEDEILSDEQIQQGMELTGQRGVVFRLLLAIGLRPMELCGATWTEINLDTGIWVIPGHRMKYKDADHTIYLSYYALGIFKAWGKTLKGKPRYVFPTTSKLGHLRPDQLRWGFMSSKNCRSTCRTRLQELGCPLEVRSRISHHQMKSKIEKAYDKHKFNNEAKIWWQTWGEALQQMEPDNTPIDNVVAFRG